MAHIVQVVAGIAAATAGSVGGFLAGLDPAWIALIGTLFGGVVLKVTEKWLGRTKEAQTEAKGIRDELRTTVNEQKSEIKELEEEADAWRDKYYDLRDSYMKIQTELQIVLAEVKKEARQVLDKSD